MFSCNLILVSVVHGASLRSFVEPVTKSSGDTAVHLKLLQTPPVSKLDLVSSIPRGGGVIGTADTTQKTLVVAYMAMIAVVTRTVLAQEDIRNDREQKDTEQNRRWSERLVVTVERTAYTAFLSVFIEGETLKRVLIPGLIPTCSTWDSNKYGRSAWLIALSLAWVSDSALVLFFKVTCLHCLLKSGTSLAVFGLLPPAGVSRRIVYWYHFGQVAFGAMGLAIVTGVTPVNAVGYAAIIGAVGAFIESLNFLRSVVSTTGLKEFAFAAGLACIAAGLLSS